MLRPSKKKLRSLSQCESVCLKRSTGFGLCVLLPRGTNRHAKGSSIYHRSPLSNCLCLKILLPASSLSYTLEGLRLPCDRKGGARISQEPSSRRRLSPCEPFGKSDVPIQGDGELYQGDEQKVCPQHGSTPQVARKGVRAAQARHSKYIFAISIDCTDFLISNSCTFRASRFPCLNHPTPDTALNSVVTASQARVPRRSRAVKIPEVRCTGFRLPSRDHWFS